MWSSAAASGLLAWASELDLGSFQGPERGQAGGQRLGGEARILGDDQPDGEVVERRGRHHLDVARRGSS